MDHESTWSDGRLTIAAITDNNNENGQQNNMMNDQLWQMIIFIPSSLVALHDIILHYSDHLLTGNVRLAGSGLPYEGRLEVYYNGRWGTVCDDSFGDVDARVACRSIFGSQLVQYLFVRPMAKVIDAQLIPL